MTFRYMNFHEKGKRKRILFPHPEPCPLRRFGIASSFSRNMLREFCEIFGKETKNPHANQVGENMGTIICFSM